MSEHTQGKLSVGTPYTDDGSREIPLMGGPEGLLFIAVAIGGLVGQEENARRIAAAWNACQGIPTEVLEAQQSGGLPWSVADQIEARVTLGELAGLLLVIVNEFSGDADGGEAIPWVSHARAAIARATGGKTT